MVYQIVQEIRQPSLKMSIELVVRSLCMLCASYGSDALSGHARGSLSETSLLSITSRQHLAQLLNCDTALMHTVNPTVVTCTVVPCHSDIIQRRCVQILRLCARYWES